MPLACVTMCGTAFERVSAPCHDTCTSYIPTGMYFVGKKTDTFVWPLEPKKDPLYAVGRWRKNHVPVTTKRGSVLSNTKISPGRQAKLKIGGVKGVLVAAVLLV